MHIIDRSQTIQTAIPKPLNFLWLEITGKCNLACAHCYASSSPRGNHGKMQCKDWERVLVQASELHCRSVQFIGGEPTTHPDLVHLLSIASSLGMDIEVYTNLVHMTSALWNAFQAYHVRVATSFYSARSQVHEEITRGQNSFQKTVRNIEQVIASGLPLRVGLVEMRPDQAIEDAELFLRNLGVDRIRKDTVRSVGRGETYIQVEQPEQALCGACAYGKACIVPSGCVYPCVFARWLNMGSVLESSLHAIIASKKMTQTRQRLNVFFIERYQLGSNCMPRTEPYLLTQDLSEVLETNRRCDPFQCDPNCEPGQSGCNPDIQGCDPTHLCLPDLSSCAPEKYPPCAPDKEQCPPDWDSDG